MSSQSVDDGFHEIQLNGKQLVFLFMAATVVSVVIFLCGVLVGRGVHADRSAAADGSGLGFAPLADVSPSQQAAPSATPTGSDPTRAVPPPTVDDLSYFKRLESSNQPAEELRQGPEKVPAPAENPRATAAAAQSAPGGQPAAAVAVSAPVEPGGAGFALQLAALRDRGEAEAIAKRLSAKGYAAYVVAPPSGTPQVYRVRVGKFKTRHEAETVAAKLQKDEQFTPWITR